LAPPCTAENPHAKHWRIVAAELATDPEKGLTEAEARERLERCGPNTIEAARGRSLASIILEQFKNLFIALLLAATIISLLVGEVTDALLIIAIIVFMAILGAYQEYRAEKTLEKLKELAAPRAKVVREGELREVEARDIAPGDIIVLEEGDRVPADARLVEAVDLYTDESMLTGESTPVHKQADKILPPDTIEPDRVNMVYMGTHVVRGRGKAIVTATGRNTYLGRIARMVTEAETVKTPFQEEMDKLAKKITVIIVVIAAAAFLVGYILHEARIIDLLLSSVALAVAAVPEGLPAIVVITLSIAAWKMAQRNALVRRLAAVEALGAASLIASDKTGTITKGEMTVKELVTPTGERIEVTEEGARIGKGQPLDWTRTPLLRLTALTAALNNNAQPTGKGRYRGDPLEIALLHLAEKLGLDPQEARRRYKRIKEIPFTSERKRMTVVVEDRETGERLVLVKGAPEIILERTTSYMTLDGQTKPLDQETRRRIEETIERDAARGYRLIALAYKQYTGQQDEESLEQDLTLLCNTCLIDPPRPEVPRAVKEALQAGIKVVMVTGDHPATAKAIAEMIGLPRGRILTGKEIDRMTDEQLKEIVEEVTIYARVTPEHKARIVKAYQANGHVVAVTGDGVNDAPALKLADIGVAMGKRGTDIAREAADIILLDDNFATIIAAVEEGRRAYDNVKKTTIYLLSANLAEVATVFYAAIAKLGLIFTAAMLLWINIVTDGFPAAGMAFEPPEPDYMKHPPRARRETILGARQLKYLLATGAYLTIITLLAYHLLAPQGPAYARAAAFGTLMYLELALSLTLRRMNHTILTRNILTSNKQWLAGYLAGAAAAAAAIGPLAPLFKAAPLTPTQIITIIIATHAAVILYEEARKKLGFKI